MSDEERAEWDADRLKCKLDPIFLSGILGFDMQETPHRALFMQFPQMQNPTVDISKITINGTAKKTMILWPRGLFKTSAVIVEIVQLILNYPNIRILFLSGSDDLAKRQLGRVKSLFEKPPQNFADLFPEFCYVSRQNKRTKEWEDVIDEMGNAHEFVVPSRYATVFAEPTMCISTAKSVKAGSHFDLIFIDDLVNETNYRSPKMLDKVYQDYLDIIPLLEPNGVIVVTGTRYSFDDAYERIQENAKSSPLWTFSIRDCWSSNCKNCGCSDVWHDRNVNIAEPPCIKCCGACPGFQSDGTSGTLFPPTTTHNGRAIGHSMEFLLAQKAEIGDANFALQYENKPIATEQQLFTETLIGGQTIFDAKMLPNDMSYTFAVGDLADSQDSGDMSVLYVVRKFAGQLFIVKCYNGQWGPNAIVENVIRLLLEMRPAVLYLEKTMGSGSLTNQIQARAAEIGLPKVPIEFLNPGNTKGRKHFRISGIQPWLIGKRLWIWHGIDGYETLVKQLTKFPRIKRDDFADCLGWAVEAPTGIQFDTPPQPATVPHWLARLHQAVPVDDDYPDCGMGSGICG
jgi:hypothetical protein